MKLKRYIFTVVLPLIIFIFLAINVSNNRIEAFDAYVYSIISNIISNKMTNIMVFITFLASGQFLSVISVLLILNILVKKHKYSFYTAMMVLNISLSSLINVGLKSLINRTRPNILKLVEVDGLSFPSGHSMAAICFYGYAIFLFYRCYEGRFKRIIITALAVLISFIGFSRIYLGVHYTSDVLGGFSFGLFWIGIFTLLVDKKQEKHA